jgi:hypothetical protein
VQINLEGRNLCDNLCWSYVNPEEHMTAAKKTLEISKRQV